MIDNDEMPRNFQSEERWYVCARYETALEWIICGGVDPLDLRKEKDKH